MNSFLLHNVLQGQTIFVAFTYGNSKDGLQKVRSSPGRVAGATCFFEDFWLKDDSFLKF